MFILALIQVENSSYRRFKSLTQTLLTGTQGICVCSNSRNDVPPSGSAVRNHCCSHPALCVRPCCVCSVLRAHAQIRRTPPPTFSDTAVTDRHFDTTIFQLTGCGYPGLLESKPSASCSKASTLSTRPGSPLPGICATALFFFLYAFAMKRQKAYRVYPVRVCVFVFQNCVRLITLCCMVGFVIWHK